jgi:hypothetical protein
LTALLIVEVVFVVPAFVVVVSSIVLVLFVVVPVVVPVVVVLLVVVAVVVVLSKVPGTVVPLVLTGELVVSMVGLQPTNIADSAAIIAIVLIIILKIPFVKIETSVNPGLPAVRVLSTKKTF